jgi:hypothetical protein
MNIIPASAIDDAHDEALHIEMMLGLVARSPLYSRSLTLDDERRAVRMRADPRFKQNEMRRLRRRAISWIGRRVGIDFTREVASPLRLANRLFVGVYQGTAEFCATSSCVRFPTDLILKPGLSAEARERDIAWGCGSLAVTALQLWAGDWETTSKVLPHFIGEELLRMWREVREVA